MHIIKSTIALKSYLTLIRKDNKNVTIGMVPTMGALHEGHASLIDRCVEDNDVSVCSIFVNPTQFGDANDLKKYPKPIENDIELLSNHGCSILFLPNYEDIYPNEYKHKTFDLSGLDTKIEGASRPGHFQGVCNVVFRFFDIIQPTDAYFGQKDFQQAVVVKHLVSSLELPINICIVPIKREAHGLAMSSRNIRLSKKGRQNAAFIYKALTQLKEDVEELGLQQSVAKAKQLISAQKGTRIDYLLAVNSKTLDEVNKIGEAEEVAIVTVVEYEGVRLLDNIIIK